MKPVMIRAFGRTGTTLMMQLLNTSEEVFVPNDYPFESRYLSYLARLAKVPMNENLNFPDGYSWNDGQLLSGIPSLIGPFPYDVEKYVDKERLSARFLIALWNQFSEEVALNGSNSYKYYAEKVSMDAVHFIHKVLNHSKSIYLIRDPRAELASIISFNNKMGYKTGFGWKENDTDVSFAERMVESRRFFFRSIMGFFEVEEKDSITIRYEDLVSSPNEISTVIGDFLGVKLFANKVAGDEKKFSHHMTNSNPKESLHSWKDKISKEAANILEVGLDKELRFFKYIK